VKFKFWKGWESAEPVVTVEEAPPEPEPVPPPEPEPVPRAEPERAPQPEPEPAPVETLPEAPAAPEPPPFLEAPETVTLTIDEAKAVIRQAGGDVIQVGFLASAYRRHLAEDPHSSETAASRKRLRELVSKRLKDRGLLAPEGTFELREEPAATE
jgi:outer membrane biosynthesis protein TonB